MTFELVWKTTFEDKFSDFGRDEVKNFKAYPKIRRKIFNKYPHKIWKFRPK